MTVKKKPTKGNKSPGERTQLKRALMETRSVIRQVVERAAEK
jgi:hypothetical protein